MSKNLKILIENYIFNLELLYIHIHINILYTLDYLICLC